MHHFVAIDEFNLSYSPEADKLGFDLCDLDLWPWPFAWTPLLSMVQSTPVISRLLGAKIRERELSGSPFISRYRAKATTREFRITDTHSQPFTTRNQYVER